MRILFIAGDRTSDAVIATGILGWMVDNWPRARFTVVCAPLAAPLFAGLPRLDRVIPMVELPWAGHWWDLWKQVGFKRWSRLVDLRGSLIGQALVAGRRHVLRGQLFGAHRAVQFAGLIKLRTAPSLRSFVTADAGAAAAALIPDGAPVLSMAPGSGWDRKTWPVGHFADLAEQLTGPDGAFPGWRVAAFGLAEEAPLTAAALARIPPDRRIDLAGKTDLAVLQACLQRCAMFIGNDSAPMHLAAAAGTVVLGLFGPTRDDRNRPWSHKSDAIRTPESTGELARRPEGEPVMASLSVDRVAGAAAQLWRDVEG
jgi:lipopolysaccharide export system permease protein